MTVERFLLIASVVFNLYLLFQLARLYWRFRWADVILRQILFNEIPAVLIPSTIREYLGMPID